MKRNKIIIIFFIFVFSANGIFAQKVHKIKKEIGFQINPYFNRTLFDNNTLVNLVFALRGGVLLTGNFAFGIEFSGNLYKNHDFTVYNYNPGIYLRYLLLKQKKWHPFLEANVYYKIGKTKIINDGVSHGEDTGYNNNKLSYFFAPGIIVPIYKKMVMFDFMIKVSSQQFFFGGNVTPSYRIRILF